MIHEGTPEFREKYYDVSWPEFHRDVRKLGNLVQSRGPWKGIIAVTRGGLVPAGILSRELNIRHVDTVCIKTYEEEKNCPPEILKGIDHDGDGWLVIEDLVDTGNTCKILREMLPKACLAAVYAKPQGKPLADITAVDVAQNKWILLPWEVAIHPADPLWG